MTKPSIIIGAQDDNILPSYYSQYLSHQYKLRMWWNEGYKPLSCIPTKTNKECAGQQEGGGVGLGLWLSYGDNPPPGATFNPGVAFKNVWDWWWYRKAIGNTNGTYDITVFIQRGLGVEP